MAYFFLFCETTPSPYINHFIQPDTIIPNPSNPQSLNRYGYVGNNPVRFNDPTGHMQEGQDDGGIPCYPGELVCQLAKSNNNDNGEDDSPTLPFGDLEPDAEFVSYSLAFGFGEWFWTGSLDLVWTWNYSDFGLFISPLIKHPATNSPVPVIYSHETCPSYPCAIDSTPSFTTPTLSFTKYRGVLWGNDFNIIGVDAYSGPFTVIAGSGGIIAGEAFTSVNTQTGLPDGKVVGLGTGATFSLGTPVGLSVYSTNSQRVNFAP